jgi:glycosyltransferase involved in cell wall biosynthesis
MNILQVISSTRTSGAEKHIVVLSASLRQRGHDVIAVCPPGGWLPEQLRSHGIPAVEMPMRGMLSGSAILGIRRLIRATRADLIHTHLTRATYLGYFAAQATRVPVASSVHITTRDLVYRFLPRRNHWFIAVSDHLRQALIARGVSPRRVQTVYNGTDFDIASQSCGRQGLSVRAELGLPAEAQIVGQVGRVDEFKGARLLVQAARHIVDERPRAYFMLVGRAEPAFQQELWEMAERDGIGDRLRFTGVRDDVPRLMDAADVITVPSQTEMFGMVVIEAMAMGKPVVATRAGAIPELIADGETGMLVERRPEALAGAVSELLGDPSRARAMGEAGRARAADCFSARVMAQNMERAYQRIVSERRAA